MTVSELRQLVTNANAELAQTRDQLRVPRNNINRWIVEITHMILRNEAQLKLLEKLAEDTNAPESLGAMAATFTEIQAKLAIEISHYLSSMMPKAPEEQASELKPTGKPAVPKAKRPKTDRKKKTGAKSNGTASAATLELVSMSTPMLRAILLSKDPPATVADAITFLYGPDHKLKEYQVRGQVQRGILALGACLADNTIARGPRLDKLFNDLELPSRRQEVAGILTRYGFEPTGLIASTSTK